MIQNARVVGGINFWRFLALCFWNCLHVPEAWAPLLHLIFPLPVPLERAGYRRTSWSSWPGPSLLQTWPPAKASLVRPSDLRSPFRRILILTVFCCCFFNLYLHALQNSFKAYFFKKLILEKLLLPLIHASLAVSCMCPDWRWSLQPWHVRPTPTVLTVRGR